MPMSVSVSSGRGDGRHNTREFIAENVDRSRIKDDIIFVNQSLPDAYRQCFGDACEVNNARQVLKARMLTPESYLSKIEAGQGKKNNPKPFYESVIQIGNKDDAGILSHPEMAQRVKEVLTEYAQGFQSRNPNLHVFCEVLHMDEATPHLHIDWIPVAGGYKKGMPLRNSLEKAMNQQGLAAQGKTDKHNNGRAVWQDREKDFLVSLCREHGLEAFWERHEIAEKKLSVADFKKLSRINERMASQKLSELENIGFIGRIRGRDKKLLSQASDALGKQITTNYKALGKERERLRIRSIELDASAASNKAAEADLEQQREALERQRQQMEEQARLNQLALDNQRRAIRQEKEKTEKLKAEAEKNKADAEKARQEAAEKAAQAVSDKSLSETLIRQLKADKAAWEADRKTWKPVEEANKAQREAQAALDKAVKDGQAALDRANRENREKLDEANRTAKNNLDLYNSFKTRFLESDENVKSLTKELAASKAKINEVQNELDEQVKNLTDEISDREYTIQNYEDYITSLRNENYELDSILDEKKLTAEEEGRRRAYAALSDDSREKANMGSKFNAVDPTEEFLQKNIRDVKRERNRIRERSRGMER
ncbi:plasmid recombination protein [Dialister succinatiphilus]|jgi:hypothetical protein|uniref:plasmid recombination protein n=1 Tax=Dialister succinatiphilus TaxID=487173 RepID=UPI004025683C